MICALDLSCRHQVGTEPKDSKQLTHRLHLGEIQSRSQMKIRTILVSSKPLSLLYKYCGTSIQLEMHSICLIYQM